MKYQVSACAVLLLALSPVSAQLATSHTPAPMPRSGEATAPFNAVGKPMARVNGTVLTDRDFRNTMYTMFPYARQHNGAIPKAMESDIRSGAMKMMVFEELCYQEAVRRKMTVPPQKLHKAETDFIGRFNNPREFQDYLQQEYNGSRTDLFAKIKRSLLIDEFLKAEIDAKAKVSDAEARAYYDKNPQRFQVKESISFQTISILPPDNATPAQLKEARTRAESAYKQAKDAKTYDAFGLLAEKYSDDDYRVVMGDHKAVERSQLPPAVVQAGLTLKPDQVSDLIQIGNAWTIVKVNKHIPAGKMKFEEVKPKLVAYLEKLKTEQLRSALDAKLHQNAKIETL